MYIYTHKHVFTYIHTYIHTYIYVCTYVPVGLGLMQAEFRIDVQCTPGLDLVLGMSDFWFRVSTLYKQFTSLCMHQSIFSCQGCDLGSLCGSPQPQVFLDLKHAPSLPGFHYLSNPRGEVSCLLASL